MSTLTVNLSLTTNCRDSTPPTPGLVGMAKMDRSGNSSMGRTNIAAAAPSLTPSRGLVERFVPTSPTCLVVNAVSDSRWSKTPRPLARGWDASKIRRVEEHCYKLGVK